MKKYIAVFQVFFFLVFINSCKQSETIDPRFYLDIDLVNYEGNEPNVRGAYVVEADKLNTKVESVFLLSNDGEGDLKIINIQYSGDSEFSADLQSYSNITIRSGEELSFMFDFLPTEVRTHEGIITITTNDSENRTVKVAVIGNVLQQNPVLSIEPELDAYTGTDTTINGQIDLGKMFNLVSGDTIIKIKNTGDSNLIISKLVNPTANIYSGNFLDFNNLQLAVGESQELKIQYFYKDAGNYSHVFEIHSNDVNSPRKFVVSAEVEEKPKEIFQNVVLTTQQEVNDFGAQKYVNLHRNLDIKGDDITDLTPLSTIKYIKYDLDIDGNAALTSLSGLENITECGHLFVGNNAVLTNVDGLQGLTKVGGWGLSIYKNPVLKNLDGLSNVTISESGLGVAYNDELTSIEGLSKLSFADGVRIEYNDKLASLKGLESLTSIGDSWFVLQYCAVLNDISALSNLTTGGKVSIVLNPVLNDFCSLSKFVTENSDASKIWIRSNGYNPTHQNIKDGQCKPN